MNSKTEQWDECWSKGGVLAELVLAEASHGGMLVGAVLE